MYVYHCSYEVIISSNLSATLLSCTLLLLRAVITSFQVPLWLFLSHSWNIVLHAASHFLISWSMLFNLWTLTSSLRTRLYHFGDTKLTTCSTRSARFGRDESAGIYNNQLQVQKYWYTWYCGNLYSDHALLFC